MSIIKDIASLVTLGAFIAALMLGGIVIADRQAVQVVELGR